MTATVELAYRLDGPEQAPVVVLGASIGTTKQAWAAAGQFLARDWRTLAYDTRGHGDSPVPRGPYTMSELASDVLSLADRLGVDRFAFCGLSIGGAIGQQIAIQAGHRLHRLVLLCTAANFTDLAQWDERAANVRDRGMAWLREPTRPRWFTDGFSSAHPDVADRFLDMLTGTEPEGYASCCDALHRFDVRDRLSEIRVPTLVIAGDDDPAVPVEAAHALARGIAGAQFVVLDGAAHIPLAEHPDLVGGLIRDFLAD